jgi:hypothetical protein
MADAIDKGRRALLQAIPVAGLAAVSVPAMAAAETVETPILALFRQHCTNEDSAAAHASVATGRDQDDDLDRHFYERSVELREQIMALPCTCAADFAAKLLVDTGNGCMFSQWETGAIWAEARALTGVLA